MGPDFAKKGIMDDRKMGAGGGGWGDLGAVLQRNVRLAQ